MDSNSSLTRSDINQSLTDGDLKYLAKNSSSLVVERTSKRQYADNPAYSNVNKNLVVNFQTGVDYIDGKNSYLRLIVKPVYNIVGGATAASWGQGSILNLIEQVTVKSRSGSVLGRVERANLLQYYETKYNHSHDWFGTNVWSSPGEAKQAQGVGLAGGLLGFDDAETKLDADGKEYNIPLAFIHSFFAQEVLLPSMVCKGLRLEITLADPDVAFKGVGGTGKINYLVEDAWVSLDSYRLTDDAMRKINDMSETKEGLVLQYHDWENSQFSRPAGVATLSNEVRKTVSMANSAFAVTRGNVGVVSPLADSLIAEPLAGTANGDDDVYQFRIGSMYMPQTPLKGVKSWYSNAMYCKGNLHSHKQPYVMYDRPDPTSPSFASAGTAGGCYAVACVDLDRYWLDQSGLAINNNVTLNLTMTYGTDTILAGKIDLFLKHTRRIVVYSQNIVVLE